ncbi:MAG: hypothetical protein KA210_00100 [Bacteroidia bacterium]|nr:hypothetical protein [Bacteroidia bacterium]
MKKIISIISLLLTTVILLSSLFTLTQFNLRGYTSLSESQVTEIQKKITENPEYFNEEDQRSYAINVDMKEVSQELEKRSHIISKSEEMIVLVILGISILFIINIYNLVIAFQEKKISVK